MFRIVSYSLGMTSEPNRHDDPVRVGATIRALREKDGWALGKFAVAVGTTHPHMSNIEAGRKRCTPTMARRIADTLGVPLAAITTSLAVEEIAG
ncbi:helix-turn-helix transcriptional regulator [Gordonia sp. (in: high G+C Gram-positive bacteria)]|jgi:transcriptional regulator with XRE-family HTH domain|uniref:helix-turn-helix domain-containing protein n=2 Tax=Gordonia sp. (in: high G+C Gram-positive bacteria) TaxID=84139 RepID=UPI002FD8A3DC